MPEDRHTRTEATRSAELTKGAINLCLSYQTKVRRDSPSLSLPSDLWGMVEAAQPEIALDKEQMAPGSAYQDARSEGVLNC